VIRALYRASQAGVPIQLGVRGTCCLRPAVPGISETIQVSSVVGRFLEHSRVFSFGVGDEEEIYISSADWMPRNLYERVEVLCPLLNDGLKRRLKEEILGACLADNSKSWFLDRNGNYARLPQRKGVKSFGEQDFLMAVAEGAASAADIPEPAAPPPKATRRKTQPAATKES